jgi:hypothetical protein
MNISTNFPDDQYLQELLTHLKNKVEETSSAPEMLMAFSGISMNWIADYITDLYMQWTKETIPVNDLFLTGTNPEWNKIIIEQCERSPQKLRALMDSNEAVKKMFAEVSYSDVPILIRFEDDRYKLLDGMHRSIAAIRDGHESIVGFVGKHTGKPAPLVESHVIYDLLKAYHRGLNTDREGLIVALRFLANSYPNVRGLLTERFTKDWLPSYELQTIIKEALGS